MTSKRFTVTRAQARQLERISERMDREGGGVPFETVQREWLNDMATELRRMAKAYARTRKGAAELLDALSLAEVEGVDPEVLAEIRRGLGEKVRRRNAA